MKPGEILNALNVLLVQEWPERMCYINFLPKNFMRPSFLIEQVRETRTDSARHTQEIRMELTVTCFCGVDTYRYADQMELLNTQAKTLDLLSVGKLHAGGRAVTITASAGGSNLGEAYVDVTVSYCEDRGETRPLHKFMNEMNLEV